MSVQVQASFKLVSKVPIDLPMIPQGTMPPLPPWGRTLAAAPSNPAAYNAATISVDVCLLICRGNQHRGRREREGHERGHVNT